MIILIGAGVVCLVVGVLLRTVSKPEADLSIDQRPKYYEVYWTRN